MSPGHADTWSHPGHYLVDPYTWPWSPNVHGHGHEWPTATLIVQCQSALPFWDTAISKFGHENPWSKSCVWSKVKVVVWPSKFKGQGYGQVQTHCSQLSPRIQPIFMYFISWQSDHLWLRYSKFYIWPWKFKVKVMAKVKLNGQIWALMFNRFVCFSFRGNRTIFVWDIANSIFDLENVGQGHDENRPKSNQVIYRSGPTIRPKMKEIQKVVEKLNKNLLLPPATGGVRTGTKI